MPRRRRKATLTASLLAIVALLVWQFTPLQAIFALSNLTDPAKLSTLGERGANSRLNKTIFWLDDARSRRVSAETAVHWSQFLNGTRGPRASLVRTSLLHNLKIADGLGLLTSENRERLKRGNAAIVTRGPYAGEPVEIDHIVPFSVAPELENELANLEMLPRTENRRKSDRIGERQLAYAEKFLSAGMLRKETMENIRSRAAP
jgi:hypothetical protein